MSEVLSSLLWIVVFPGFLFSLVAGLVATWVARKVSALVQWRVGPPLLQPFYDIGKLLGKEVLIPDSARPSVFLSAPLLGMSGVLVLSVLLWRTAISGSPFVGDVIVAMYLMVIPSLALIMGSSASASPHASIGAAREMKLVMGYELPLALAVIVAILKAGGQLDLVALSQQTPVWSVSGMMAFLVSLLCFQAKLGFVPFDIAESETELASGVEMEYSGAFLALWQIMRAMMLVALPLFAVIVFLGGFPTSGWGILAGLGKYVLVLTLLILIKNTNPRMRIDQAVKFFWIYAGTALALAVVLAAIGSHYGIGWL